MKNLIQFQLFNLVLLYSFIDSSVFIFTSLCVISLSLALFYILFSGRAGKILDTAAKIVVIVAGSSNLYKNHGGGSDSNDDTDKDKEENKNKKDAKTEEKTDEKTDKNETNQTNNASDSNTASK